MTISEWFFLWEIKVTPFSVFLILVTAIITLRKLNQRISLMEIYLENTHKMLQQVISSDDGANERGG